MASESWNVGENDSSLDILEAKKTAVTSKLQRREEDRQETVSQRREEKESAASKEENTNLFFENFLKIKNTILEAINSTGSVPKTSVADHLSQAAKELDSLCKYATEAAIYLPSYDLQRSQSVLSELQDKLQNAQDQYLPKKKFAFKSKSKPSTKTNEDKTKVNVPVAKTKTYNIELNEIAIKDKTNETVLKHEEDVNDKDIVLANLTNCTIKLEGVGSSMQVDGLTNCKVLCGPVSRSVFINNCINCTFVLACQQLRIHHTNNTSFYIHVTTRAIIEDTTNVKFGKYCYLYSNIEGHWTKSGLSKHKNNWNDVDDFNYLASDAKSPNWSLVSADEQSAMENNM